MGPDDEDPLDWTVDKVVEFLCHNPSTPWSQSTSQAPRPGPAFEASIRENEITGEVLLHDVDKETLREDLGLKALGHRSSMLMAIRYLQRNSSKYQSSRIFSSHFEENSSTYTPTHFTPTTPGLVSPVHNRSLSRTATPQNPWGSSLVTPSASGLRANQINNSPSNDRASSQAPRPNRTDTVDGQSTQSEPRGGNNETNTRIRPLEQEVRDTQGRKRRRLDLRSLNEANGVSDDRLVSKSNDEPLPGKRWYMGPNKLALSQLFYPLSPDEGKDGPYLMIGNQCPTGQRAYVNSSLKYSHRQQLTKLSSNDGINRWAMVPYKDKVGNKMKHFTLYTSKNGQITVSQEETAKWPQLKKMRVVDSKKSEFSADTETLAPSDPLSYLLSKYPAEEDDQDALPLYGDSGSEGEFDEDTWQEINDDQNSAQRPATLTSAEIDSVISQCVHGFEEQWVNDKKPKEAHRARNLWLKAKRAKSTNEQIKGCLRNTSRLEKRLEKLKEAVRENQYSAATELQTQCQCLESTVHEIQRQKWHVSVLEQDTCPPQISAPAKPRPKPKQKNKNVDEESLSESDNCDVSMSDFIVDDSGIDGPALPVQGQSNTNRPRTPTLSETDSEDDIISPSGKRRQSRPHRGAPLRTSSPSSRASSLNREVTECIDLTLDSSPPPEDHELTIETPPLNPVQSKTPQSYNTPLKSERDSSVSPGPMLEAPVPAKIRNQQQKSSPGTPKSGKPKLKHKPRPKQASELYDFAKISSLPWETLEERKDRRRLLAKLIASISDEERAKMIKNIPTYDVSELKDLLEQAFWGLLRNQRHIEGLDESENDLIMRLAMFFISWVTSAHISHKQGIKRGQVVDADRELAGFPKFFKEVCAQLGAYRDWDRSRRAAIRDSGDLNNGISDEEVPDDTPRKTRKKEVKESQEAKLDQQMAQQRVAQQNTQRKKLERRMERMGFGNDDPDLQAVSFGEPVIYLDGHIGARVKPHQLHGIQFMWRELIQDEKRQGCLLAHTMGLGKTMQVISLLVTISAAASSDDPSKREQIPERFRRSHTLILCPSSLIDNWYEEFLMWTPELNSIGPLRKITPMHKLNEKLDEVSGWNQEGGILIMSYDIFRNWIHNKETKARGKPLSDRQHEQVKQWLLEGPNIVVADEAHKMKNTSTGVSLAAQQFRTTSRIALTGTPLANNLLDYYTMIDWIAKDYLGSLVQFKANYIEPIESGLYADSGYGERRRSLMKLQVLKEILSPKINRADISVLEGSLPPKVEFVLTIPLTEIQKAAYNLYVNTVMNGETEVGSAKVWSFMAILGLCCNHPASFRDKLLNLTNDAGSKSEDIENMPGDEPMTQLGIPDTDKLVYEQERLFSTIPDINALDHSYRAQILNKIVDESIKAGDKVLIFSHSLPTLDYLENVMKMSNRAYCRLDGRTPIAGRQAATKHFNTGSSTEQIYLISTRAGGLGLNILGANRVIIFDFGFNPAWEQQAVGRAYRLGQQKPVFVYRFLAGGTFEERLHNKALFKTQLAVRVVDKKDPVRQASKYNANNWLFPVKDVGQEDVSEYLGKDPDVLDKILENDSGDEKVIRKIAITETFQREENDKLTEEEKKDVQDALDDERLRFSDPQAYQRRLSERARADQAPYQPNFRVPQNLGFPQRHHMYDGGAPMPELDVSAIPSHNPMPHAAVNSDPNSRHAQSEPPTQGMMQTTGPVPPSFDGAADQPIQQTVAAHTKGPVNNAQRADLVDKRRLSEPLQKDSSKEKENKTSCKPQ